MRTATMRSALMRAIRNARRARLSGIFFAALAAIAASGCVAGEKTNRKIQLVSKLGRPLIADPPGDRDKLERNLAEARAALALDPSNPEQIVWVGRRLGYLWRIREAIEVYTDGISMHPDYAPLYRHRGHRYITLRMFHRAIDDLERAAELIEDKPDKIEPDGAPNKLNIPLTTTAFNVWYHLGLARYLSGDFEGALTAYRACMKFSRRYDDNLVATTDWMYMTLRRLGREEEAKKLLEPIHADMEIIENSAYHQRLLMYKGLISPEELLPTTDATDLDWATLGYGLGNWYYVNGELDRARVIWRTVVSGRYWPAFGYIAAEVDLARLH